MDETTVSASRFKAECLALLDRVAETHETLIVTKRGRPVARISAVDPAPDLRGSATFLVSDEELIAPVLGEWDADRPAAG